MIYLKENYYCVALKYGLDNAQCFVNGIVECYAFHNNAQQFVCPVIHNERIIFETPPNVKSEIFCKALMDRILYME